MTKILKLDEHANMVSEKVVRVKRVTNTEFMKYVKDMTKRLKENGCVVFYNPFDEERMSDSDFYYKINNLPLWKSGYGNYPKIFRKRGDWSNTYYALDKPCKDFIKLQKMLATKRINLDFEDVRIEYISGKRSDYDYGDFQYLCHDSKTCLKIIEWLKANKWNTGKLEMKIQREMNDHDRYDYDGYDTEREWSGSIHHVMVLKIKTPTGRVRAETEFY